jgi:hypothetical protein
VQVRPLVRLLAVAAAWTLVSASGSGEQGDEQARALGERLYLRGLSATGSAVAAVVQGDLRVRSTDMTCVNCHRRSGWGTVEGPVTTPAVAGRVLFAPVTQGAPELGPPRTTGVGTRPAYTEATLARAMRDGIDPAGRAFSPTMPRYDLSDADAVALTTYLRSLSAERPAGVNESVVHLATIVTPEVDAQRRASMLDVLRRFVQYKNGEMRHETRRRQRGPWDMKQHYENYRKWELHEWDLHGDPASWPDQLARLYEEQPVFAILGGMADDWRPMHAFSERFGVPAVLPQATLAPAADARDGFYSLYFSSGVVLEAQALARHLARAPAAAGVLQVSRCRTAGEAAAAIVAERLPSSARVRSECLQPTGHSTAAAWGTLARGHEETVVLWLDASDLAEARRAAAPLLERAAAVYLSSTLIGDPGRRVADLPRQRARLMHPFVPPNEFDAHAWRSLTWLKANGLEPADRVVAVNTLYAAMLVSDALNHPRTLESREYFVERIEHMTSRSPQRSAYPSVTFDARRRFASLGCYILELAESGGEAFRKVEPWFVPGH